jgi:hypothetical protein
MGQLVCLGAMLQCSFGVAPSSLLITPENMVNSTSKPSATIMDNVPIKNVPPFGMCTTQSNPAVAAATTAALGVPTPAPCMPVTTAPWTPGSPTVLIKNKPALNNSSKLMCTWGGVIQVNFAGQATVNVP